MPGDDNRISVNVILFAGYRKHVNGNEVRIEMSYNFQQFTIGEETEIEIDGGEIALEEHDLLESQGTLSVEGWQPNTGKVSTARVDVEQLSRLAFEYSLLKEVASSVQTDILEAFRKSDQETLTTAEITRWTNRPKSSVSRALSELSKKGKITKVQAGVYRH